MDFTRFMTSERAPILQVAKSTGAAIATWFICVLIYPEQIPIFGAIAALICVQENVSQSLTRGLERMVGVVVGVTVALGATLLFGTPSWLFIVAILVALGVGWLLKMSTGSSNQIAITTLLMIALGGSSVMYGVERIIETLIGAAIGVTVNALVVAPVKVTPAREAINTFGYEASIAIDRLADALSEPRDKAWLTEMLLNARLLSAQRNNISNVKARAYESLQLNPRATKYRAELKQDEELLRRLDPIVSQIAGMTRAVYDNYDEELLTDPGVQGMTTELRKTAHDLRRLISPEHVRDADATTEPITALTAPFTILEPNSKHWILIGSLMEDLRRLRNRVLTGE